MLKMLKWKRKWNWSQKNMSSIDTKFNGLTGVISFIIKQKIYFFQNSQTTTSATINFFNSGFFFSNSKGNDWKKECIYQIYITEKKELLCVILVFKNKIK